MIDHYEDDWSRLWWVRLARHAPGSWTIAARVELLAAKYPQYRERPPTGPVIAVAIEERTEWTSLAFLTATEQADLVRRGEVTPRRARRDRTSSGSSGSTPS